MPQTDPPVDVARVIADGAVEIFFQPIASMRRQGLVGVEALTRCTVGGAQVPPQALFAEAERAGRAGELDRLCRERAVQGFRALHARHPGLVLFVNCHPATLADAPREWPALAARSGVDPRNLAVEVSEEEIEDLDGAIGAAGALRELGFLVALDDVGVRSANLDRIAQLHPDIIKADQLLVRGVGEDYHRREVLRSLVVLSERLGGWVIAEGVETADDAVTVAELGGDMLQGYLLGRPYRAAAGEDVRWEEARVVDAAHRFRERRLDRSRAARGRREARLAQLRAVAEALQAPTVEPLDERLARLIRPHADILSAAVLDEDGTQLTETALNPVEMHAQKTVIFAPPPRGTDHSLKEYYYLLREGESDVYETAPYVPLPTGGLAVTLSTHFEDASGARRILAVHVRAGPGDLDA